MNASCCRASALCEEFSDYVIYDESFESVLVNVNEDYFSIIYRELGKIGYVLVFKTYLHTTNSLTCTFIKE
jgi:hypothetical protein|tara:strand:+ start:598 stop:810 length:213 start_codon:yes stop_codon:yes gene_type:complete